jgi:hypothetical protein
MTINKAQGQTTGKIIVNINRTSAQTINKMTLQSLYVALSRVRTSDDLRFFPKFNPGTWDYLRKLEYNRNLITFLQSYDAQTGKLQLLNTNPTQNPSPTISINSSISTNTSARLAFPQRSENMKSVPTSTTTAPTTKLPSMHGSSIFVPLILNVLCPRHKYSTYNNIDSLITIFGHDAWNKVVEAYKVDFRSRQITAQSIPISQNGYIDAKTQEYLLYTITSGLGSSTVSDIVFNLLITNSLKCLHSQGQ